LQDRLADRLVADVEPLLQHGVPDQLVRRARLLLGGVEAALGVAARAAAAGERGTAAVGGIRGGGGPEQADHRDRQRRTPTHPEHRASSPAVMPVKPLNRDRSGQARRGGLPPARPYVAGADQSLEPSDLVHRQSFYSVISLPRTSGPAQTAASTG